MGRIASGASLRGPFSARPEISSAPSAAMTMPSNRQSPCFSTFSWKRIFLCSVLERFTTSITAAESSSTSPQKATPTAWTSSAPRSVTAPPVSSLPTSWISTCSSAIARTSKALPALSKNSTRFSDRFSPSSAPPISCCSPPTTVAIRIRAGPPPTTRANTFPSSLLLPEMFRARRLASATLSPTWDKRSLRISADEFPVARASSLPCSPLLRGFEMMDGGLVSSACARRRAGWRVIPGSRAHRELSVPMQRSHGDVHGAERSVAPRIARVVGQGVLIADIVRDLRADVFDILKVFGEKRQPAGSLGKLLKFFARALRIFLAFLAEQSHGINHRVGLLRFFQGLLERLAAGVVFAVGDHQENFLVPRALLQVVERADDRVVKGRRAAGINALQGFFHVADVAGEILVHVEIVVVVEVHHEAFVRRIAGAHEDQRRGVDALALVAHAAAVVNHQAKTHRNVFALEDREFLLHLVFKHAELFLFQSIGKAAAVVEHGRVQDHQVDVNLDPAFTLALGGRRLRPRRRRRRRAHGNLRGCRQNAAQTRGDGQRGRQKENSRAGRFIGWVRSSPSWHTH